MSPGLYMEKLFGLIGFPISHSFSSKYFTQKFAIEKINDCRYLNLPISDIEKLTALVNEYPQLTGLNVTIPYKESVLPYLATLSKTAFEIGAVNSIKIVRQNNRITLHGYNTDAYGFYKTLTSNHVVIPPMALIIGSGGASKAVEWVLRKLGCNVWFVSRNPKTENQISYTKLKDITLAEFPLIVNATPLGMYPDSQSFPDIPYQTAGRHHTFIDLIYNPAITVFMSKAMHNQAKAINGLTMLEQQAEKSWEIWTGGDDEMVFQ